MRASLFALAALVSGCAATMTPASEASDYAICEFTMGRDENARVATVEARRRGLDCTRYYPAIAARQAAGAAQAAQALQYFNRPAPPLPAPSMGRCETRLIGNVARTDCF